MKSACWMYKGLGEIHFSPTEGRDLDRGFRVASPDDTELAALLPLDDRECLIPFDHGEEVAISTDSCWELRLTETGGGVVGSHTLFRPAGTGAESLEVTPELAAWAGLTILGDPALARPGKG